MEGSEHAAKKREVAGRQAYDIRQNRDVRTSIKATRMNVSSLQSIEPQLGMLAIAVKQSVSFYCLSGRWRSDQHSYTAYCA